MKITFRMHLEDPVTGQQRRFTLTRNMPYPHAPRPGDYVIPPVRDDAPGILAARQVWRVVFAPDGTVLLDIQLDGLGIDPEPQLTVLSGAGYVESEPG